MYWYPNENRERTEFRQRNIQSRRNMILQISNPRCLFLRLHNECADPLYPFEEQRYISKVTTFNKVLM